MYSYLLELQCSMSDDIWSYKVSHQIYINIYLINIYSYTEVL